MSCFSQQEIFPFPFNDQTYRLVSEIDFFDYLIPSFQVMTIALGGCHILNYTLHVKLIYSIHKLRSKKRPVGHKKDNTGALYLSYVFLFSF